MTCPPLHAERVPSHVVGAASLWVVGQVTAPRRTARVVHAGLDAAYLDVDGTCLGVLAAGAVLVPCGIRTALPSLPPVAPGSAAVVVAGAVELTTADGAQLDITVTGLVDTTVPVLPAPAAPGRALGALAAGHLAPVRDALPEDALRLLADGDPASVLALLGLGPGLTPLGDDVLAGWLATAVASRHPQLARVRDAVTAAARRRTTTLSATLLGCAGRGEVVPDHRSLLLALARDDTEAARPLLDAVLGIGATSGAGMVLGTLLALTPTTPNPSPTHEGAAG